MEMQGHREGQTLTRSLSGIRGCADQVQKLAVL